MKKAISLFCLTAMLITLFAVPALAEDAVRLGAMTGPTGIGMLKLIPAEGQEDTDYTASILGAADELTPLFLQGQLDIVSVPANLAANLYNKTEGNVRVLAVNVLGVLYIAEYGTEEVNALSDLKGKTLYATGKGSTPEYFLRYVLTENGIDPDSDLTIEWKSEPGEVVALLNAQGSGIAMLPQPYASVAAAKLGEGYRIALSISDEWARLDNGTLCTTAVVMARAEFVENNPEAVEKFLSDFAASVAWVNENAEEAAVLCGEVGIIAAPTPVVQKAIPLCNLVCITGQEMKEILSGCLQVIFDQNPKAVGGEMPGDPFYYGAE